MESEEDRKAEEEEEKEEQEEKELEKVKKVQEEKLRNAEQSNFGKSYRDAMKRRFFGKSRSRSRIDTYPKVSANYQPKTSQTMRAGVQQRPQQQQAAEKKL